MSCFIVDPKTIGYISNYIADNMNGGFNRTNLFFNIPNEHLEEVQKFIDDVTKNGIARENLIYKKLYLLNWQAFNTRYEYRHPEELDKCSELMQEFKKYDTILHTAPTGKVENWHYQMLKSIECYLYQCSEGAELEKSGIYQYVLAMKRALTEYIVSHSPEYKAAKWG